jgi:hypothetical protein
MLEYKIHTQRDKTFSGAFDPPRLKQPSMRTPRMDGGLRRDSRSPTSGARSCSSSSGPSIPPAQRHEPDTNGETPLNHRGVACCSATDRRVAERRPAA